MNESEFTRHLHTWLLTGPSGASPHVLDGVLDHVRVHPRRGTLRERLADAAHAVTQTWRAPVALRPILLMVLLGLAFAAGAFAYASWNQNRSLLPLPSPSTSPGPSPSSSLPVGGLYSCPPGTKPDQPGPSGQQRPVLEGLPLTAFDRGSGRIVTNAADGMIWSFDVCANSWQRSETYLAHVAQDPRAMAYDEVLDLVVIFDDDNVVAYDADSDALTLKAQPPTELREHFLHAVYRRATGQFVVRNDDASLLWTYDLATDTWGALAQGGDVWNLDAGASLIAYDPTVDDLVLYIRRSSWTEGYRYDFDTSVWTRHVARPPTVELVLGDLGRWEIAYDEAHARTVVLSRNRVVTYDAATGEWQVVYDQPPEAPGIGNRSGVSLVYDSINEGIVVLGGHRWEDEPGVSTDEVVAFDLDDSSWRVLLEPTSPTEGLTLSPSPELLAACPPGTDPDQPGPIDQDRPQMGGGSVGPLAFDRQSGRVVTVRGGWVVTGIWTFDVCNNTWSRSAAAWNVPGEPVAMAYDETLDLVVIFADNVATYDADADVVRVRGRLPDELRGQQLDAVYRHETGELVIRNDHGSLLTPEVARLWTYDASTDTWYQLSQGGDIPARNAGTDLLAYDPTVDDLVLYIKRGESAEGYRYDFDTSAWTRQAGDPPVVGVDLYDFGWEIAYDEARARTVVIANDRVIAYDAATRQWEVLLDQPIVVPGTSYPLGGSLVYDSVNERIFVIGGDRGEQPGGEILTFDLDDNSWTVLLEPGTQP